MAAAASSLTVFIAGGNSNTGSATIKALLKSHANVTIKAGARDPKKAAEKVQEQGASRVTWVEHDVKDGKLTPGNSKDAADLKGVDTLVLVPPQVYQDRIGVTSAYVAAAKAAGVKHIVFMSTPIAKDEKLILGKELFANEKALKASGIPTTYLHCVMFYENHWGNLESIKTSGAFYYPAKNDVAVPGIAVEDIGEAAANVVSGGAAKHGGKTYTLSGPALTWDQCAAVYSRVLLKACKFVSVSDDAALKSMSAMGFPDVMSKGLVELHHWMESAANTGVGADKDLTAELQALLNGQRKATTFAQWLTPIAPAFGQQKLNVFVAGGASNTGSATINALLKWHPNVTIKAGVRDEKKAGAKFTDTDPKRLTFVVHDVKDGNLTAAAKTPEDNAAELKGIDALVLVPPQSYQDRVGVVDAYIAAAKGAGVKHVVFMSTPIASSDKYILGKDLFVNENALKASGLTVTYMHLVMFFENQFGNAATIKEHGAYYAPIAGNVPVSGVAVADIGEASANVLADGPAAHGGKTYFIGGPALSYDEVARVYTRALGKPVKFVSVPDEAALKAMVGMGLPEIMAKGLVELIRLLEKGVPENQAPLQALLNDQRKPTTFAEWLAPVAGAFGPANKTVFVAGASGNTGSATVNALLKFYPTVTVRGGVRDAKKAEAKFPANKRLSFVSHDVKGGQLSKDSKDNAAELKGVDALVIVLPQEHADRAGFVSAYAKAAKEAGVKHIVYLTAALREPMLLAKDFNAAELALKNSAVPTTYLQLTMFFENFWGNKETISKQGAYYYPAKPNVPVQGLSCADIGEAAAAAAIGGPALHGNKVYYLGGAAVTWDQVAAAFTKVLGKPVRFVQVPDDAALKSMLGAGLPEALAKGMIELFHVLDTGVPASDADLVMLLGRKPQTYEEWLAPIAAAFK